MFTKGIHYKGEKKWDELQAADWPDSPDSVIPRKMIVAHRTIATPHIPKDLPSWANDGSVFSFGDRPGFETWSGCEYGEEQFNQLLLEMGGRVIGKEFELTRDDEAYVVDRAHYCDMQYGRVRSNEDAIRAYVMSRVPVSEYQGDYRMPELIVRNEIALARFSVCDTLEYSLRDDGPHYIPVAA